MTCAKWNRIDNNVERLLYGQTHVKTYKTLQLHIHYTRRGPTNATIWHGMPRHVQHISQFCPLSLVLYAVLQIHRQLHGLHMYSADPSTSSLPIVLPWLFHVTTLSGDCPVRSSPTSQKLSMLCIKALLLSLISGRIIRCLCRLLLIVYGPTHAFIQACNQAGQALTALALP